MANGFLHVASVPGDTAPMRIGVIGSGQVAQVLGAGLAAKGHEVMLGSRSPEKLAEWAAQAGERASVGSFEDSARFGELVVLATLGAANEEALAAAGHENLAGKVLIDLTNPLDFSNGPPPGLLVGHSDSGGEQVQRAVPEARVVKALNIVGNALMVDPDLPGGPPDMLIAGNDDEAKRDVDELLQELGWPPAIDLGGIEVSRYLEPLCILWVLYGFKAGSWDHAFKLLRR